MLATRPRETALALAPACRNTAEGVKVPGRKEVGSEVGAKEQTVDVKAALMVDKSIDADTKTVTLKGTVPTAAQKAAAERVAREKAEGYKVKTRSRRSLECATRSPRASHAATRRP
jgi:hypothetical protein